MITSHCFGHKIYWDEKIMKWRYCDTDCIVSNTDNRLCPKCHLSKTKEGHDPCLGTLPGIKFGCCGHGIKEQGYLYFENGVVIQCDINNIKQKPKEE